MIVDAHAHISDTDYGNINGLIKIHNKLNIEKGVLVPGGMLDVRIMTKYVTGEAEPTTIIPNNSLIKSILEQYPDRFFGFYCIDPNNGKNSLGEFEKAIKEDGFSGLKLSPMTHQFSMTGYVTKELAALCGDMEVPFYTHVLYNPAASTAKIGLLAKEFPKTTFIIGHLGFGPSDTMAFDIAKEYDNVYLETSTANTLAISEAYRIAGANKLIFGSEYPLSNPEVEMKKIEVLGFKEEDRDLIMGKNILNILHAQ